MARATAKGVKIVRPRLGIEIRKRLKGDPVCAESDGGRHGSEAKDKP